MRSCACPEDGVSCRCDRAAIIGCCEIDEYRPGLILLSRKVILIFLSQKSDLIYGRLFAPKLSLLWWWWVYPTHFWGWDSADQLRRVPVIGRLPTDRTRGQEEIGYGQIWPDADGPVQGSLA